MSDFDTYVARAAEARAEAGKAKLQNVRERCLRAAAAWEEMAERVRRTERMRAASEAEKKRSASGNPPPSVPWPANLTPKKIKDNEQQTDQGQRVPDREPTA